MFSVYSEASKNAEYLVIYVVQLSIPMYNTY
jgi:hypothetical protein